MRFTSSKGIKWFLHSKEVKNWGRGKITILNYYFDHNPENTVAIPNGKIAVESKKGMPMLKKI